MQVLKVDCCDTVPPGAMSITCPDGHEIWRGHFEKMPLDAALEGVPKGSTLWVSVLDWAERIASGVPRHALN